MYDHLDALDRADQLTELMEGAEYQLVLARQKLLSDMALREIEIGLHEADYEQGTTFRTEALGAHYRRVSEWGQERWWRTAIE